MAGLGLLAVGLGLLTAWLMGSHESMAPLAENQSTAPSPPSVAPVVAASDHPAHASTTPMAESAPPSEPAEVDSGDWEQKLQDILLSGGDENDKADKIRALMTAASPDAQVELSQHLINMTQDDHYDGAAELLTNATTQAAVSTVLMNDLLNRNNTLKMPMLLDVAREDDHPLKGQAREMLELLLQEDHGTNWDDWSTSISSWLAQNQ